MTDTEKLEIVNMVLSALSTNSTTIDQLIEKTECVDDDFFETNKSSKISFKSLMAPLNSKLNYLSQKIDVFRNVCSRFEVLTDETKLPSEPAADEKTIGYLIDKKLYLYVGKGGDVLNGKYINVGDIVGPQGIQGMQGIKGDKGDKGEKGEQGNSGVSGSTDNIEVVNNLDGGESTPERIKVLAAEQGKVLNGKFSELESQQTKNFGGNVLIKNVVAYEDNYIKILKDSIITRMITPYSGKVYFYSIDNPSPFLVFSKDSIFPITVDKDVYRIRGDISGEDINLELIGVVDNQ